MHWQCCVFETARKTGLQICNLLDCSVEWDRKRRRSGYLKIRETTVIQAVGLIRVS